MEKGDISTTIVGTGNLEGSSAQDVTMPSGVKVDKDLVESGDSVQKGDTLATVDADSVKQAMLDVQEEIDELDEEIEETKDDSTSSYVTAKCIRNGHENLCEKRQRRQQIYGKKRCPDDHPDG